MEQALLSGVHPAAAISSLAAILNITWDMTRDVWQHAGVMLRTMVLAVMGGRDEAGSAGAAITKCATGSDIKFPITSLSFLEEASNTL